MSILALQKIGAKYKIIFTTLFLACFACASISLVIHSFSHKFAFLQNLQQNDFVSIVLENVSEKENSLTENFIEKKSAKNHQAPSHDLSHCALCFLSNVQNNATFAAAIIFTFAAFYLFIIWRNFNRTKLAYLSSSFSSRAPPFVS